MSDKFPNGWTNILLSDLTTICKDITYGILKPGPYEESGVPMLRVKDIRSNQVDDSEIYKVSLELAEEFSRTTLEGGEIVVSIQGTVGKVAIVPNRLSGANVSRTLAVIAPLIPEFGKWIRFFLLSPSGQSEIIKRIGGTTRASLNLRDLRQIEIKVAPLVEQHRIVAKIEELFTRLDAGVETLKQVQAQLKRYRQSVLKAAVEGRLTAEWRGGHQDELEPADKLLERIQNERKAKLGKKFKKPTPINISGLPKLPKDWAWTNLNQIKEYSLYGPRYSSNEYSYEGYSVLRTSDISDSGKVNTSSTPKLKLSNEEYLKYSVKKGDLLITRSGSIGILAVFNDNIESIPGAYLIQYRICAPMATSWYVFYFMKSPTGQNYLLSGSAGIGRPNLNAPTIEAIPIPFPSYQEQEMVVLEIERLISIIEETESIIESELERAKSLRQSILKRAFEGKLAQQDPNDEPASSLLERIKAEKAKSEKSKRTKQMELL